MRAVLRRVTAVFEILTHRQTPASTAASSQAGDRAAVDGLRRVESSWAPTFAIDRAIHHWLLKPGLDYNLGMIRTVEAIVDEKGQVWLAEPIQLSRSQRALVTILDEEPSPQLHDNALLSERALAEDWNRPEEDEAWAYLGEVR